MQKLIVALWLAQGVLMFFDEFKFHHMRGLKRWERVGHPIDSFFFLIPFMFTQFFSNTYVFISLCVFSCLLVTKDEFIHNQECPASEQWLHAVLFLMHPVSLYALWIAWQHNMDFIIQIQSVIIFIFMSYQIIYWNFIKGIKSET